LSFSKHWCSKCPKSEDQANVGEIKDGIKEAIDLFNEGKWALPHEHVTPGSQENDSGEEFDLVPQAHLIQGVVGRVKR